MTEKQYAEFVYNIVNIECDGMDAIYGDYIERLVGSHGLNALVKHKLVEPCGVINLRRLYTLVERKEYAELARNRELGEQRKEK